MKKVFILILLCVLASCEKYPCVEDDKKLPLDSIKKPPLWAENDSVSLVFYNNTKH